MKPTTYSHYVSFKIAPQPKDKKHQSDPRAAHRAPCFPAVSEVHTSCSATSYCLCLLRVCRRLCLAFVLPMAQSTAPWLRPSSLLTRTIGASECPAGISVTRLLRSSQQQGCRTTSLSEALSPQTITCFLPVPSTPPQPPHPPPRHPSEKVRTTCTCPSSPIWWICTCCALASA